MRPNATNTSHDAQSPRFEIDHAPFHRHASGNQHAAVDKIQSLQSRDWQLENLTTPNLIEPVVAQPPDGRPHGEIAVTM